jgi:hypothetical protein
MIASTSRRDFLRNLGVGAAAAPFLLNLPSLGFASPEGGRKQRLVVMFSPNGVIPSAFWPDEEGENFTLKESLSPLEPWKSRTLILGGVCDKIKGDGDSHMRGIGCLLTGIELFPGNIQGGSHTPAGWAKGLSIDQEIRNFLQAKPETKTRFGSLEFGVNVPDRADTWTRMVYTGGNKPVAPINDPYQMLNKMYGQVKDQEALKSVLDEVREDLDSVRSRLSAEDRRLLEEHAAFVRDMEQQLLAAKAPKTGPPAPELPPGVKDDNENIPRVSKLQIDLMVNAFANDFSRIATLQYTNSVGQARMKWIGVDERHHELSHKPDTDKPAVEQLTKINRWFCEQLAYLAKRLSETPEQGGEGSMLDHTTIMWTNELGKGNSHTLNDIPFVLVGGGLGFKTGRSLKYKQMPHNRLLLALAHGFGHRLERFGNPDLSSAGPLNLA